MHAAESYGIMMKNGLYRYCVFTGHCPSKLPWKYDEKDERCVALKRVLTEQISKLAAEGVTDFCAGMALGVDTWVAVAVLDLRDTKNAGWEIIVIDSITLSISCGETALSPAHP